MNDTRMLVIFFLLFLISCSKEKDILEVETMGAIVADLHIAEIAVSRENPAIKDSLFELYLEKISKIHEVDPETITKNLEYLMEDSRRHEVVYQWAKSIIQELEADYKEKKN